MHSRKLIKQKFQEIIIAANTDAGDNVQRNRWIPDDDDEFPLVRIYAVSEPVEQNDIEVDRRKLDVIIESVCNGIIADEELDELTDDIENALIQDLTLQGTVSNIQLKITEISQDEGSGSSIVAARMTYEVEYFTARTADDPTDDFETVEITGGIRDSIELDQ